MPGVTLSPAHYGGLQFAADGLHAGAASLPSLCLFPAEIIRVIRRAAHVRVILTVANTIPGSRVRVEMVKISSESPEPSLIRYAADQIRAGEVLGMPTDTFYGLAAEPFNLRVVERVYDIKSRSRHKPLRLLISVVDHGEQLVETLTVEGYELARWVL